MTQEEVQLLITAKDQARGILSGIKSEIIAIGAAYFGWSAVKGIIGDIVAAGKEAEVEMNNLRQAVERHLGPWDKYKAQLEDFSGELMKLTGNADEAVMRGLQKLIDAGQDTGQAMDTMRVAADLAAGTQMDLLAATDLLAKAQLGATGMLSRYGIVLDEGTPKAERLAKAVEQINARFGGAAAENMKTLEGATLRLSNAYGEFLEEIYKSSEAGAVLKFFMTSVAVLMEDAAEIINLMVIEMRTWYTAFSTILNAAAENVKNFAQVFADAFSGNVGKVAGSFSIMVNTADNNLDKIKESLSKAAAATSETLMSMQVTLSQMMMQGYLSTLDAASKTAAGVKEIGTKTVMDLQATMRQLRAGVNEELGVSFWNNTEEQLQAESDKMMSDWADETISGIVAQQQGVLNDAVTMTINANSKMLTSGTNYHKRLADMAEKTYGEMTEMMSGWATAQIDSLVETGKLSADVFDQMAKDFMKFFIEKALEMTINMFIPGLGSLLGSIFDTPRYDRMAMTQGLHFAQYFTKGALGHIRDNFIPNFAGSLSPQLALPGGGGFQYGGGGGSSAPMVVEVNLTIGNEVITKAIAPKLVEDSRRGGNRLVTTTQNLTGGAAELF